MGNRGEINQGDRSREGVTLGGVVREGTLEEVTPELRRAQHGRSSRNFSPLPPMSGWGLDHRADARNISVK